ncbi:MAG: hypothetical protein MUC92_04030 [Fimbriimonadaceae bacterium]|jgi:hypothetical protein|nr:hypothetical protein [Fimbriimonadaceae bacterium]
MKFILITKDAEVVKATEGAFQQDDVLEVHDLWSTALDACDGADLLFVDMVATLEKPHKISGYEKFAEAKMIHEVASPIPVVLIWPPEDYELDFITGYPNFVFKPMRRPVDYKMFRRMTTYV